MRLFASGCAAWAAAQGDPSQKQSILSAARSWAATADAIERYVEDGRGEVVDDLKAKLN